MYLQHFYGALTGAENNVTCTATQEDVIQAPGHDLHTAHAIQSFVTESEPTPFFRLYIL